MPPSLPSKRTTALANSVTDIGISNEEEEGEEGISVVVSKRTQRRKIDESSSSTIDFVTPTDRPNENVVSEKSNGGIIDNPTKTNTAEKTQTMTSTTLVGPPSKSKRKIQSKTNVIDAASNCDDQREAKKPRKKEKKPSHQILTERSKLPKLWNPPNHSESYTLRIASWNVAGLRALLKKSPTKLTDLVEQYKIDIVCLQETKLQSSHIEELGLIHLIPGYDAYFSCSTAKKGYSGTGVFVKSRAGVPSANAPIVSLDAVDAKTKPATLRRQQTMDGFLNRKSSAGTSSTVNKREKQKEFEVPLQIRKMLVPEAVSFSMGIEKHDCEGRMVILDFPHFFLCNVYVPNSGQGLDRLSYRVNEWDKDWLAFCQSKQKTKPIMWLGDLNVAHTNLEVWNDGASHLSKQAGVTPEERASFQDQLDAGFVDVFRRLHPEAKGHYSYWSQRAGNRMPNKGLRLDYFVCDRSFFPDDDSAAKCNAIVRDSYVLHQIEGSDHCPVVLELEIVASASASASGGA